ncbi:MAG: asparaginase, partial [Planctomycetes bacterium]|nr:asparaginase [Planctomycetota bacterium]
GVSDVILAEVTRGWSYDSHERAKGRRGVESVHRGSVVVADVSGRVVAAVGDDREFFLRSSAKPFQALAALASGAADHFGFGSPEIALFSASHSGERMHVDLARSILARLGLAYSDLECGVHAPIHRPTLVELYRSGGRPITLHNNCSGKHLGLLALARSQDWPIVGYVERDHPVQEEIFRILGMLLERDPADIPYGTDGCGVPTARVRQSEQARLFALLANPDAAPEEFQSALDRIARAMVTHPELVAGTGRLNTQLLQAAGDAVVAKTGAEGSIGVGLRGRGLGISVKVGDGNARALGPVLAAILRGLGVVSGEKGEEFCRAYSPAPVTNARGERVGGIRAARRTVNALLKQWGLHEGG